VRGKGFFGGPTRADPHLVTERCSGPTWYQRAPQVEQEAVRRRAITMKTRTEAHTGQRVNGDPSSSPKRNPGRVRGRQTGEADVAHERRERPRNGTLNLLFLGRLGQWALGISLARPVAYSSQTQLFWARWSPHSGVEDPEMA
jgi:hypothetical protein